jgi:mannose-1-phosphate guanylyltransferase
MRYVLIMAGGSGKRLWPLSRAERIKELVAEVTAQLGGSCA